MNGLHRVAQFYEIDRCPMYPEGMDGQAALERIEIKPDVCNGRPVVRGTRITAQTVLEFLAAGDTIEDVLAEYPSLTREDVLACLAYGARALSRSFTLERSA